MTNIIIHFDGVKKILLHIDGKNYENFDIFDHKVVIDLGIGKEKSFYLSKSEIDILKKSRKLLTEKYSEYLI